MLDLSSGVVAFSAPFVNTVEQPDVCQLLKTGNVARERDHVGPTARLDDEQADDEFTDRGGGVLRLDGLNRVLDRHGDHERAEDEVDDGADHGEVQPEGMHRGLPLLLADLALGYGGAVIGVDLVDRATSLRVGSGVHKVLPKDWRIGLTLFIIYHYKHKVNDPAC